MVVRVPPHSLIDVDVLDEEGHQQVDEKEELEKKAPVKRQVRDVAVAYRSWGDQGSDGRRREADGTSIPVSQPGAIAAGPANQSLERRQR